MSDDTYRTLCMMRYMSFGLIAPHLARSLRDRPLSQEGYLSLLTDHKSQLSPGFILLTVQAHLPQLRPAPCNMMSEEVQCAEAEGFKSSIFFIALYLVALGSGCLKPNMIAHGADQFRKDDPAQSRKLSTYFNSAYFSFCVGELVALTALVWVQTRSGMDVGFAVSAAAMGTGLLSLVAGVAFYRNKPPQGSILTPIARVFVAAITKRKHICPSNPEMLHQNQNIAMAGLAPSSSVGNLLHTDKFRFLDKACIRTSPDTKEEEESSWRLCTVTQVEQVKVLLSVVPIFACTIVFNTILAQLQTFSVQQGSAMDTRLTESFSVPPASLQALPYLTLIALVPAYELLLVPLLRRLTGHESGVTPLQRIGVGLFAATFSMVSAALVEKKRRDRSEALPIMWIAPQFLIFGVSEMFTAVGLIEFFYKQSMAAGMQSFLTAMTYCSYSFGFFLSSLLVSLVNRVTGKRGGGGGGWLGENDLDKDRLDLFYWMMAGLSALNFFNYLFWSGWYSYNPSMASINGGAQEAAAQGSSKRVGDENILNV